MHGSIEKSNSFRVFFNCHRVLSSFFLWKTLGESYRGLHLNKTLMGVAILLICVGEILVYLLFHQIIFNQMLPQLYAEQYMLILIMFSVPFFLGWSKINRKVLRMERDWIR